jgi:hypothetical protein
MLCTIVRLLAAVVFCVAAASIPAHAATTFYLSPTGSDSNACTIGSPCLTPASGAHAKPACGDTVILLSSTSYNGTNFGFGNWGTVDPLGCTLPNPIPVRVTCQVAFSCTITANAAQFSGSITIDRSYYQIDGMVFTKGGSATDGACVYMQPSAANMIHHLYFFNNVSNACGSGGYQSLPYSGGGPYSPDYFAIVGNIIDNATQGTSVCGTGISNIGLAAFDKLLGTHIYIAGNFTNNNVEGSGCAGGGNTDGEGIQMDLADGSYSATATAYTGQIVIENNLSVGNGGAGFIFNRHREGNIIVVNNTAYGNNTDPNRAGFFVGEFQMQTTSNEQFYNNIGQATVSGCCSSGQFTGTISGGTTLTTSGTTNIVQVGQTFTGAGVTAGSVLVSGGPTTWVISPSQGNVGPEAMHTLMINYGLLVDTIDASDVVDGNWWVNTANTAQSANYNKPGGFVAGSRNVVGISPAFANPFIPASPGNCAGMGTTVACMRANANGDVIAGFIPTAPGAIGMGYQAPLAVNPVSAVGDGLFPAWMCGATLPTGLISKHC